MTDRPTQMADTSPGLGEVLEKTDSSDSESSSDVGSEEEYHPNTPASSSEEEWESPEKLSSQKNGESSTSTSDVIRRKTGREVDEDGDPEMSSTKGMDPLSDRETAGSDTDDEGAEILLTQKNKPQTKKRLKRHGDPEMSSRKGMDPLTDRETAGSDTDGEVSTSISDVVRKKTGRDDDGDPEMSSTKGTDPLADTETAGSDTDNVSQGVPLTQSKKTPPKKQQTPPSKSSVKRPWTEKEKSAVNKHLGRFVGERKVPGKKDCTACIEQERALAQRSWKDVKNFVYNTIVAHKRRDASRFLKF
ncbi:serine-rich 25 kDa antigen protein-like isoform X5 [Sphaeramia orbicularis]|uniref:serine-rich 25 kDa antigen protein-like isoform X5 n=1 Tax=Sphaeramia orbicularis TaxID=375764 RepID=UPI001180926F|nr:serine-rich 25 kDa antigen protein-like isoform X5 [Sphaeramia orbicularis]